MERFAYIFVCIRNDSGLWKQKDVDKLNFIKLL